MTIVDVRNQQIDDWYEFLLTQKGGDLLVDAEPARGTHGVRMTFDQCVEMSRQMNGRWAE